MRRRDGWLGSADGTRLFWQAWLPEEPPAGVVVVVHGAGEHGGRYGYVAERLAAAGFATYAMDHRGHGRSDGPRAFIDRLDRLVEDMRLFLKRVGDEHPDATPFLIGHSLGGAVAATYALRYGETIAGLVLSDPAVATEAVPAALRAMTVVLSAVAPRLPVFKIDAQLLSRDPAVVRDYLRDPLVSTGKLPARTLAEILRSMQTLPDQVGALDVPLLLLHGTKDQLCPPEGSRMIHERARSTDKTLRLYDGLYHEIFNEPERDRVIDDVVAWLGTRAGTARREEVTSG
jgi:acylglycerol lipase